MFSLSFSIYSEILGNIKNSPDFVTSPVGLCGIFATNSCFLKCLLDQGLFSVPALVFELAQLTSQKRFDGGYVIFEPSTSFLGTSYGQIVVAVFT